MCCLYWRTGRLNTASWRTSFSRGQRLLSRSCTFSPEVSGRRHIGRTCDSWPERDTVLLHGNWMMERPVLLAGCRSGQAKYIHKYIHIQVYVVNRSHNRKTVRYKQWCFMLNHSWTFIYLRNIFYLIYFIIISNILYYFISYHIILYYIILYHIIYHIVSYRIVSYHISYHISYYIILYLQSLLQMTFGK
jgi:hypothetical protein